MDKNLPASAGDTSSTPGPGKSAMPRSNQARVLQPLSLCCSAKEAAASRSRALQGRAGPAPRSWRKPAQKQ